MVINGTLNFFVWGNHIQNNWKKLTNHVGLLVIESEQDVETCNQIEWLSGFDSEWSLEYDNGIAKMSAAFAHS